MRVFIVAATPRGRRGLETLLNAAGAETVGLAADLHDASDEAPEKHAEVILADAGQHSLEEWLEEFQEAGLAAGPPLVALFEEAAANVAVRAVQAGVRGVLPSEAGAEQILSALDAVSKGLIVLHPAEVSVARPARSEEAQLIEPLTPREREGFADAGDRFGEQRDRRADEDFGAHREVPCSADTGEVGRVVPNGSSDHRDEVGVGAVVGLDRELGVRFGFCWRRFLR